MDTALKACAHLKSVRQKLQVLNDLGLGYLTLGEETPSLSGGEAQRLKLASEMGKAQSDSVFVFDEPTIGLHPLDVRTLLDVFQTLIENGATVVVIEHDLDVIRNADYIIDMGPGGGEAGEGSLRQEHRRKSGILLKVQPENSYRNFIISSQFFHICTRYPFLPGIVFNNLSFPPSTGLCFFHYSSFLCS